MNTPVNNKLVCFGEILWDILPTGAKPGGAPMNVAYHLNKLGMVPSMITRIGLDDWGKRLLQLMQEQEISTDYFQLDANLPTGTVIATIGEHHEVSYDIVKPVAWDNIHWDDRFEALLHDARFFVYGSLATRSTASRNTLYRLLEIAPYKVLDINLRPPHYNRRVIEKLLQQADFLKLNLAELELITGWFSKFPSAADRIKLIQDRFHIPSVVVTRGSEGAMFNFNGHLYQHPGFKVEVADTVGSGDAFFAGLLSQCANGAKPDEMLMTASALGALVASYSGPCPDYQLEEINQLIHQQALSN